MSFAFRENERIFALKMDDFQKAFSRFGVTAQDRKKIQIEHMRLALTEAEGQVRFMEIELGSSNPDRRNEIEPLVRKYRLEFREGKRKFSEMENGFLEFQARKNVLQPGSAPTQVTQDQQRYVTNTNAMMAQTFQLSELNNVGNETEQAAIHISSALYNQRKVMLDAIDDTDDINRRVGLTNREIAMMKNKEIFNKVILVGMICVLTLGNVILLYYRLTS